MTQEEQNKLINIDPLLIKEIENPSRETIRLATDRNAKTIIFLKNPTFEQFARLGKAKPKALTFLSKEQVPEKYLIDYIGNWNSNSQAYHHFPYYTDRIILKLIETGYFKLKDFDQTNTTYMDAYVIRNPHELEKHPSPTTELYREIIRQNANHIKYIPNPSKEVQRFIANSMNQINSANFFTLDEDVQKELMAENGLLFQVYEVKGKEKEEMAKIALFAKKPYGKAIQYIPNPTLDEQKKAINIGHFNIEFIQNPTKEIQMEAVQKHPNNLTKIKDPDDQVVEYFFTKKRVNSITEIILPKKAQLYALDKNINATKYFKTMHPEAQVKALRMNIDMFETRKSWSEEAQLEALKINEKLMDFGNRQRSKFTSYIGKIYLAFQEKEGYKDHLNHFLFRYLEEKYEEGKELKQIPIDSFKLVAESIYILPTSEAKKMLIATIEKNEKTQEQEQFWKEVKQFYR